MQNLSNTKLLRVITRVLILLLLGKVISLVVWWYLPSDGVELSTQKSYAALYQRVDFKNMLMKSKVISKKNQTQKTALTTYSINSLVLKGLYGSRFHGFAIVAKKSSPKNTTIVSVGEDYAGYKLKEIALTEVIFTKSEKDYVLVLEDKASTSNSKVSRVSRAKSKGGEVQKSVSKADIKAYSKDPSKIWKDIAIAPLKKSGKIVGFKVNRIKAGSKMAELGLQKGDVIIKANNIELKSFKDALNLYKKIDTIKTISLVVLRNNQEKEIIYEIY